MHGRSSARLLAPLALLVTLAAVVYVVESSGTSNDSSSRPARTATTRAGASKSKAAKPKTGRRTYTVQSGDTLSAIAAKTGVSADRITALNPDLDPQALQVGQTVKLRP